MADALLLYNPAAGRFSVEPFVAGIVRLLNRKGWRVEVAETVNGRHATQLARQAANEGFRTVFAIGGDGTVGQVAHGLIGSRTSLAVLPAGTQNVWGRELGLRPFDLLHARRLRENARILADSPARAVDVGLCNDQPFVMWAGVGLDAVTVQKLEPRKRFYKYLAVPHYAAHTLWSAAVWHGLNLRVWADEERIEGHYLLALVSNIRHYLGGFARISPRAFLDDGRMDLWLFSGNTLADAFRHLFEIMSGRHLSSDKARCIAFQRARVESDTPFPVQIDSEPTLGAAEIVLEVRPRALRMLVPESGLGLLSRCEAGDG